MGRIADPFRLRAEAVEIDWTAVARAREAGLGQDLDWKRLKLRTTDVRLIWACAATLGVPHGPFTVWHRPGGDGRPQRVASTVRNDPAGTRLDWGGVAAGHVVVSCKAADPGRPVGLFLYRVGHDGITGAVGATAVAATPGAVTLSARTSGATWAVLVNGHSAEVSITTLDEIVNADDWKPLELVGLPIDQPWPGTAYDAGDQGFVDAPVPPVEAALSRIERGAPPVGWDARTPGGLDAPRWDEPDPAALVKEIQRFTLPAVAALYDAGLPEFGQMQREAWQAARSPHVDGATRTSSLDAQADLRPWAVLALTAQIDPFLNLATGFGTAYPAERFDDRHPAIGGDELMVTATYAHTLGPDEVVIEGQPLPPGIGGAEFAAYAPRGVRLSQVAAPGQLRATRAGLVEPRDVDQAWGESIRLSYQRSASSAMLGTPTQQAAIVAAAGSAAADAIIERRDPQGWRTVAISPDAPQGQPGNDRASLMHAPVEIAIGSGGRSAQYGLAVADVFGVWSPWRDAAYRGDEPQPDLPAIVSATLDTRYAGSTAAPSTMAVDVAVEWAERRTTRIDVRVVFHPTVPAPASGLSLSPTGPVPAGCFARDLAVAFAADGTPTGVGCGVVELNAEGTAPLRGGPRPDGVRRYRLTADVPTLDFAVVRRWGAALWARRHLAVGASPTAFGERTDTAAASPVPTLPLPPAQPPGVPLASLPDAAGSSHAAVTWSLAAGADARTAIVWELAETALRQTAGLPPQAEGATPSERLVAAQAAYDGLSAARQRGVFRRIAEVDAAARTFDVTLPRGSTDIHFFVVTIVSSTAVESPWPAAGSGVPAHTHLRAVIAPRVVRPEPPLVRPSPGADGVETVLRLEAASALPVHRFRLLRTRSERAALRADTMGPPFAEPLAAPRPAAGGGQAVDAVTGLPIYEATWSGTLPPAWTPWLVRASAVPIDADTEHGRRGRESEPSDVVSVIAVPSGPPVLDDLVGVADAARTGLVVQTGTTAPVAVIAEGSHVLQARVAGLGASAVVVPPVALAEVVEADLSAPPAGLTAGSPPVWRRGPRVAGRTPLALWFVRSDAAADVTAEVTLTDPRGRSSTDTVEIAGYTPPPPAPSTLELLGIVPVALKGVVVTVRTDAAAAEPYRLRVSAMRRKALPFGGRGLPGPGVGQLVIRPLVAEIALSDIPSAPRAAVVVNTVSFRRAGRGLGVRLKGGAIEIGVPLASPVTVTVTLIAPDGTAVAVSGSG